MATQPINPTAAATATRNSSHPANELRWQKGQILHGKILQQPGSEKILRIGRHEFAARGTSGLTHGQALKLEVIQTGETPVLRLLQNSTSSSITQAQRLQDIPRQNSLLQLTSLLNQAGPQATGKLKESITRFIHQLPMLQQALSGDKLKLLLQNSGLFLENHLTQQQPNINGDTKVAMLLLENELRRLLGDRKSTPASTPRIDAQPPQRHMTPIAQRTGAGPLTAGIADYLDAIESSLARHRLNQIESLPQQSDNSRVWLLEIPLRNEDLLELLQIRIEQDDQQKTEEQQIWTVELAVAPKAIGPVHAKLTLQNQKLSITLWIKEPHSVKQFQLVSELLSNRLQQSGLPVDQIQIFQGQPPKQAAQKTSSLLEQQV